MLLVTTAALSAASTPGCVPHDRPPVRVTHSLGVAPVTFPIILDSAWKQTNNQVHARTHTHTLQTHKPQRGSDVLEETFASWVFNDLCDYAL